jgi:hypothetical protein
MSPSAGRKTASMEYMLHQLLHNCKALCDPHENSVKASKDTAKIFGRLWLYIRRSCDAHNYMSVDRLWHGMGLYHG